MRLCMTVILFSVTTSIALAVPEDESGKARDLARQALRAEAAGNLAEREALLQQASSAAPELPLVRWQQGQVRTGKAWKTYEELLSEAKSSRVLQAYREQRDASEPTLASQLKLAQFCQRNGLKEQAAAHWSAVLEFEPDHVDARKQLGFEQFDGRWFKREEVIAQREKTARIAAKLKRLTPELKGIVSLLESQKLTVEEATERLSNEADVDVIPAWEAIVSPKSVNGALAVVAALRKMTDPEASLSLVRHALWSEWAIARQAAAHALKDRDEHSYLPALMSELRGPWIGWRQVSTDGRNQLVYRFTVVADGADQQTLRVLDQAYFLQGDRFRAGVMATQSSAATESQLEARRQKENAAINASNDFVMQLLAELTGEMTCDSPQDWWQWWDDRNEVYSASGKPIETSYAFRSTSVVAIPPPPAPLSGGSQRVVRETKKDCLAGGTPILTQRGLVAVERVRIGDLVLSQHPDTGEVSLQPVLRTTIREPEPLIRILIGAEKLRASGGHLFWVSGEGWVRAREIKAGMWLHGLKEPVEVTGVEVEERATRTYNLVVAGFHSYFVGPGQVLSHDNSAAGPTRATVPGLAD